MRKCLRCENVMVDDLIVTANGIYVAEVREAAGVFTKSLGKIKCAVCQLRVSVLTIMQNGKLPVKRRKQDESIVLW